MSSWREHIRRARAAMDIERWELAHQEVTVALVEAPQAAELHAMRAEILYRQRDYLAARPAAREAISLSPNWNVGYWWLAWIELADPTAGARERLSRAEELANQAIACEPGDPDNYYLRAAVANSRASYRGAVDYAELGLQIDPQHVGCLECLAHAYAALDQYQDLEDAASRLLAIRPENVWAHRHLAKIRLRQKRYHEAYAHTSTAVRKNPSSEAGRDLHGEVVRHLHPLARFFLWTAKPWSGNSLVIFLLVGIGLTPLLSLKLLPQGTSKNVEGVLAILALVFCLGFAFYGVIAMFLAEAILAHSVKYSRELPETRAVRWEYAFGWMAAASLIGGALLTAAFMTPQPFLFALNLTLCGLVFLISRHAPTLARARAGRFPLLIPLVIQSTAMFWTPPETMRGFLPGIVLAATCITIALAVVLAGVKH